MAPFHPHFSRNLQTGASERTSSATRAAEVTIRHDAAYASRLVLPILPAP
jgi:predicted acyl esterase